MQFLFLFALGIVLSGCNYSLPKTPLNFVERNGEQGQIPANSANSYQSINALIIAPKCLECHSSAGGDAGGVNLETYENLFSHLSTVRSEVESNRMPVRRAKLTASEKTVLLKWIDAGGPRSPVVTIPPVEPVPVPNPMPVPVPIPVPPPVQVLSYERVNREVIQPRCLNCHSDSGGNRGDVNLETYENVAASASVIETEIISGSMPRPRNKPLTAEQKELILKWIAQGAPKNGEAE